MFKRVDVLAIAILIALVYVGAIIGLQLQWGLSAWAENEHLNILGDSIGGITAPLALIFLVAAVIIQRQELNLTKAELAKSAEALNNQVIEQRQHREFVGQQTELMRKEAEASAENTRKAYKLSLFDKRFAVYSQVKDLRKLIQSDSIRWHDARDRMESLTSQSYFLFGVEVSTWFNSLMMDFDEASTVDHQLIILSNEAYDSGGNYDPSHVYQASLGQLRAKREVILAALSEDELFEVFAEPMSVTD